MEEELQEAERSASRMHRLQRITAALAEALTPEDVAAAVVDEAAVATGAITGGLWLLEQGELRLVRSVGFPEEMKERFGRLRLQGGVETPLATVMQTGQPMWIDSDEALAAYPGLTGVPRVSEGGALACVPLVARERPLGGLSYRYPPGRQLDTSDRFMLLLVARYAALALERARLYESERRARQEAEASRARLLLLSEATATLSASLDYRETLNALARMLVPRFCDFCVVELSDEPGEKTTQLAAVHADPSRAPLLAEVPGRLGGILDVMRSGKSLFEPQVDSSASDALLRGLGVRSRIIVPLSARSRRLGALFLGVCAREFIAADLELAEELGRRAGIAVDNALLYESALRADRRKDEFLAMLGHELRNPLAPILTALHLMRLRGPQTFESERTIIERQVHNLVTLVDDLLDVSRITQGRITLRRRPVEIGEVIAKAVEIASPLFEARAQVLEVQFPRTRLVVEGDAARLAQALANLMANAAKYSERGGRIDISAAREEGQVVVRVRDSGLGIDREMLPRIFDVFVQEPRSIDRSEGGLGLGLTIVRSLVELHGGKVAAHSDGPGLGSEFEVRLPALEGTVGEQISTPLPLPAIAQNSTRVLIVDDNIDAAAVLAESLRAVGYLAEVAHDGPSGLLAARAFRPAVALLDIGLPVMDGYELATRMRAEAELGKLRLVAITGYGQDADKARARDAGFDEHLVKPVDLDRVLDVVIRLSS